MGHGPTSPLSGATPAKFKSIGSLLDHLARVVTQSLKEGVSNRLEPAGGVSGLWVICYGESPGLEGLVRWHTPPSPEERQEPHLLVELRQSVSKREWKKALAQETPGAFTGLTSSFKTVTLVFKTGGVASSNRLASRVMRGSRRADSWRFDPEKRDPLEDGIQKARQRGEEDTAALLEEVVTSMPPEVQTKRQRRETAWWRTVRLSRSPHVEEAQFLLRLVALQEEIIAEPFREILQMKCVRYLLRRIPQIPTEGSAHLIFSELKKRFTEPEDPRALWCYIRRLAKGDPEYRDNIRKAVVAPSCKESLPEDKAQALEEVDSSDSVWKEGAAAEDFVPEDTGLTEVCELERRRMLPRRVAKSKPTVSVHEAASQVGVSVDFVYDSIHRGKVKVIGRAGNWTIDAEGLEQLTHLVVERALRRVVSAKLLDLGKSPEAARKLVRRRLKKGERLEQLARSLAKPHPVPPSKTNFNGSRDRNG